MSADGRNDHDLTSLQAAEAAGHAIARDLPLDAHLHTALSPDSDVPIDAFGRLAVEQGIAELAITDHVDFDPAGPAYAFATFETRERQVREAAERWAPHGVAIRHGVEITYDSRHDADIRAHLRRHRYDFVIGSVHVMVDSPYLKHRVASWVAGRSFSEIVRPYFAEVLAAARTGLFDTLGHLDYVKRYLVPHITPDRFAAAPELYEPILSALLENGTALEVNTSGLRQSARETYPSPPVVARFHELGGRAITIGSDAHRHHSFAFGLEAGYRHAAHGGFTELTFRRGAGRVLVPIPSRIGAEGHPNEDAATPL